MSTNGIARINGYEILAVVPSLLTATKGLPDRWYLVGRDAFGNAVCATTYDLSNHESWASGEYFDDDLPADSPVAYRRAYVHALHKAGVDTVDFTER